jgi:hypothetical protein
MQRWVFPITKGSENVSWKIILPNHEERNDPSAPSILDISGFLEGASVRNCHSPAEFWWNICFIPRYMKLRKYVAKKLQLQLKCYIYCKAVTCVQLLLFNKDCLSAEVCMARAT